MTLLALPWSRVSSVVEQRFCKPLKGLPFPYRSFPEFLFSSYFVGVSDYRFVSPSLLITIYIDFSGGNSGGNCGQCPATAQSSSATSPASSEVLRVTCKKCGRDGRYILARLIRNRGRDAKLIDWLDELTAECPKKIAHNMND